MYIDCFMHRLGGICIFKLFFLYLFILQLILELGPYMEELKKTGGAIKEFVNPK